MKMIIFLRFFWGPFDENDHFWHEICPKRCFTWDFLAIFWDFLLWFQEFFSFLSFSFFRVFVFRVFQSPLVLWYLYHLEPNNYLTTLVSCLSIYSFHFKFYKYVSSCKIFLLILHVVVIFWSFWWLSSLILVLISLLIYYNLDIN